MDTVLDYFDNLVEGLAYAAAKQKLRGAAERTLRRGLHVAMWVTGIVAVVVSILLVAVVSYLFLYWLLVPDVHLEKPVYFNYDTPNERPEARTSLVNRQWSSTNVTSRLYPSRTNLLVSGVSYDIELSVTVPDSPRNREISMVMAKVKVEACDGTLLAQSQRPILLEYKGAMARLAYELIHVVPLAMGWMREEQKHTVKLIDGFQEDSTFYACAAVVELSKPEFEVYASSMSFSAQLTGIRYAMYYWLFTSSVFGITTILVAESLFVAAAIVYVVYLRVKKRADERQKRNAELSPEAAAARSEGEREGTTALASSSSSRPRGSTTNDSGQASASGDLLHDASSGAELMSGDDFGLGGSESSDSEEVSAASNAEESKVDAEEVVSRGAPESGGPKVLTSDRSRVNVRASDLISDDNASGLSVAATDVDASSGASTGSGRGPSSDDDDDAESAPRAELRRRAQGTGVADAE